MARPNRNNIIHNIEDAVEFFNDPEFNTPATIMFGGNIQLDSTQVLQVATFLRVINALEKIRSAIQFEKSALNANDVDSAEKPLSVALAEIEDAIEVLDEKGLHPNSVADLIKAQERIEDAKNTSNNSQRNELITNAINKEKKARRQICQLGSDATLCPN